MRLDYEDSGEASVLFNAQILTQRVKENEESGKDAPCKGENQSP